MNFDPLPEHELLRDSVREFFERELPEQRIREMDRARRIPREIWKRFAALGCTSQILDLRRPPEILIPLVGGARRYFRETRAALPARLRRLVDRRFGAYLARMGASYAAQVLGDRFKHSFRRRFAPEFWTLLVAKPS